MKKIILKGLAILIFSALCVNYPIVYVIIYGVIALILLILLKYDERKKIECIKEITQVMDSLVNVFKKQFNAELRS